MHTDPGLHGIRVEEHPKDGSYVPRAELPGLDPGKDDVEITVDDLLTAEARVDGATAVYRGGVLTIMVPVPQGEEGTRTVQERRG